MFSHVSDLAKAAGASDPDSLARRLLLLKEGAIVTAHLGHTEDPSMDAKAAAQVLVARAFDR